MCIKNILISLLALIKSYCILIRYLIGKDAGVPCRHNCIHFVLYIYGKKKFGKRSQHFDLIEMQTQNKNEHNAEMVWRRRHWNFHKEKKNSVIVCSELTFL